MGLIAKHFDEESGLYYFGRRYYQPDIGRWITPDPAGFADG
ncbi:RHS repeat-associated core domain-containing protein [Criblamydia sequanensis]